jgi:hypothetical protein
MPSQEHHRGVCFEILLDAVAPGAPRSRRIFSRDASGHIIGFVDRREARDIVWKRQPG